VSTALHCAVRALPATLDSALRAATHLKVGDAALRAEGGLSGWQMLPRSCWRLLSTMMRSKSEDQLRRKMAVETMGADSGFPTMRADMTPHGMERDVVSLPYWQRSLLAALSYVRLTLPRTLTPALFNQSRYTVLVGDPPHREVAVGALVCRKNQATTLRKLLPRAW